MAGMKRLLLILAMALVALPAHAAPKAELWDRWVGSNETSTRSVDHSPWDRFLAAYVVAGDDGINRVRYGDVAPADRAALDNYIAGLSAIPVTTLRRDEQRAFWINLYNAVTVQVVLAFYPVDSIRDIRSGIFSPGPWGKELVTVEDVALTLDDIEHRILRPGWRDPRIHYALNCASIGCPNLLPSAFTVDNTDALMTRAAREYVNHPRGVSVENGTAMASSIYDWFAEDFGGTESGVNAHLSQFADPALAESLKAVNEYRYHYDWGLNDANQ